MSTRTKPEYIQPTKSSYANLGEEILELHNKIETQDTDVDGVKLDIATVKLEVENVKNSTSGLNTSLVNEINSAKGVYPSINDRLLAMDNYDVLKIIEKLTTSRDYEYDDDGDIIKEKIRGDLNYDVIYDYDSNKNIIKETRQALDGAIIGVKDFHYNAYGLIHKVSGTNTDDVIMATNSLLMDELSKRMTVIESIDFVKFVSDLKASNIGNLWSVIQEILIRVQTLELASPTNISSLIDLPNLINRIDTLENKFNQGYTVYDFDVVASQTEYPIPENISSNKTAVFLEGLLLEYGEDYTIANGKIKFSIPLIDEFTVTCRY